METQPTDPEPVEITASQAAAALGRLGGKIRTMKKIMAARENGKKGGRPKSSRPDPTAIAKELANIESKKTNQ